MSKLTKALTAAAGNAGDPLYVEDVFSTYLYTGTGAAQTITNGIDLDGEGGLVWVKGRNVGSNHYQADTERGNTKYLASNSTTANMTFTDAITAFTGDGFTLGSDAAAGDINGSGYNMASWTFRKAKKFFDVQTYTGNGGTPQNISHSLGSVPGLILVKRTDSAFKWFVYHISTGATKYLQLNDTAGAVTYGNYWNSTAPTDSVFTIGTDTNGNASGGTYVAYLFASDAGGFGEDGSESIIKCGSYTGNGATGQEINLGFEAQWVLVKSSTNSNSWYIVDLMRGMSYGGFNTLSPNSSAAEVDLSGLNRITPTATGFSLNGDWSGNENGWGYIYIAIRRPMKTPESGTEVFAMNTATSANNPTWNSGFVTDFAWYKDVDSGFGNYWYSRLTGGSELQTNSTAAEIINSSAVWDFMDGFGNWTNGSGIESWMLKRATGFFDVVAYNGSGSNTTQAHNLGVVPELMLVKVRDNAGGWQVYASALGATKYLVLNDTSAAGTSANQWNNTTPTASVFTVGVYDTNESSRTYIAYLFATLDGVSKVGSYTGTGADLNVDCGFSAGARFILIKRTDSTGDWYVYDSERGIVAGNDPYFFLNSTAAQVTNTDYIDPLSSGFTVTSTAPAGLNASGGSYIFLAIA